MAKTLTELVNEFRSIMSDFDEKIYDLLGDTYYEGMTRQEEFEEFIDEMLMNEDYCQGWIDGWNNQAEIKPVDVEYSYIYAWHDGNYYCGVCGGSVDPIFNYCPTCGAIIDLRDIL